MLDKIINLSITAFVFLFPLFFLPVTPESYEFNKMILLFFTCIWLMFLFSLRAIKERKITIIHTTFTLPLLFLSLITLISSLFQSPNLVLSFTTPLSTSTIIAGFLLYIFLVHNGLAVGHVSKDPNLWKHTSDLSEIGFYAYKNRNQDQLAEPEKFGKTPKSTLMNILILDAFLLSLWTFALYLGILPQSRFTPAGSYLSTVMFLSVIWIFLLNRISVMPNLFRHPIETLKQVQGDKSITLLALIPVTISLVILITHLFGDQKPLILPFLYGWQVFVENLKNIRSMFLGVGPTNFVTAFTLNRPPDINATSMWNVIFTTSSSFLLTLATETGILSAVFYLWIIWKAIRRIISNIKNQRSKTQIKDKKSNTLDIETGDGREGSRAKLQRHDIDGDDNFVQFEDSSWETRAAGPVNYEMTGSLIFALLLQMILPSSMSVFMLTIILLALAAEKKHFKNINLSGLGIFIFLLILPILAAISILTYLTGRMYLSEIFFKNSLDSIVNNQGTQAYNDQRDALSLNPYLDRYHLAFSQTNLALANALAGKNELTDEDKQNIPKLIQQSIDHARSAVLLNRTNSVNWQNLGRIYESLMNFAPGAENWAIESYRQRIILDPLNPQSHLDMGRLLFTRKNDQAEIYLRQSIGLKPDLAATHYLLGNILKSQKKYDDSFRELQTALAYLTPDSLDAQRVQKELETTSLLIPEKISTSSSQLTPLSPSFQTLEDINSTPAAFPRSNKLIPTISLDQPPE